METALDLARRLPATISQDLPDGASPLATPRDIGHTLADRARAAKLLGTAERIVGYKLKKYAIDCGRFR